MAALAPMSAPLPPDYVPDHTSHEFRSPRGELLGGVFVYPSQLQPGWVHYEVLRVVCRVPKDIAEGESPSEAEAVRVAKFLRRTLTRAQTRGVTIAAGRASSRVRCEV